MREYKVDIGIGGVVGLFRVRGLLLFGGVDGMGVRCFNNFFIEIIMDILLDIKIGLRVL